MKDEILLGDTVEDIHTGFRGIAMARSEFFNGCIQYDVAPKVSKDNKPEETQGIDIQSLKRIKKGPKHIVEKKEPKKSFFTGGPNNKGRKMRGW